LCLDKEDTLFSDHKSFEYAVCLSTIPDISKSTIHTPEDTPDKVNIAFLSETASKLAYCISDTIGTIGIDNMKFTEATQSVNSDINTATTVKSQTFLTPSEFENKFNCKLDFLDYKQAKILIRSRTDVSVPPEEESQTAKGISDIKYISFNMKMGIITFRIFKIGSEMQTYKRK